MDRLMLSVLVILQHIVAGNELYQFFEADIENATLTKITIKEETGEVFVGGTNVLLHFDGNLNVTESIKLGPVNDSQQCPPKSHVCIYSSKNTSVETDDVVKIMVYNKNRRRLIVCGSAHQGMCFLYDPITHDRKELQNGNISYIGGKNTTIIVYSSQENTQDIYFVAQSYDGRESDFFYKEFSKLSLFSDNGVLKFETSALYANIEVCDDLKASFHFRFIYGFESGNYIYFIYIRSKKDEGIYETKLAQICKSDHTFESFVEISMECEHQGHKSYTMATSAYFQRHDIENKGMLYVTFGINNYNTGHLEDPNEGSALCSFSVKNIRRWIKRALLYCYNMGVGREPEWSCSTRQCTHKWTNLRDYCGGSNITGIQAPLTIKSNHIYSSLRNELLTSVAFHRFTNNQSESIIILGTDTGYLIKVSETRDHTEYARYTLSDAKIQPDPAFDEYHRNVYLLSGRKVFKFDLYSCKIHTSCGQCVTTIDPLECGWCVDHCSTKESCHGLWHDNACPPVVNSISPISGPVAGGTAVTISGDKFGSKNATRIVYLQNETNTIVECEVETVVDSSVVCKTLGSSSPGRYGIIVSVNDTSRQEYPLFDISGDSTMVQFNFTFYEPEIKEIKPLYGPKMGNTSITIIGNNLDIGSTRRVEVAGFPCTIERCNAERIFCRTNLWMNIINKDTMEGQEQFNCDGNAGQIFVKIDEETIDFHKYFCYTGNPEIVKIFPLKTIKSGGFFLIVEGKYFNSVTRHELLVKFENDRVVDQKVDCTVFGNGNSMKCPMVGINGSIPTNQVVQGQLAIALDGFESFMDSYEGGSFINYFPDPTIYNISDEVTIHTDREINFLQLEGRDLDLALTKDDFNISIDNTRCPVRTLNNTFLRCIINRALIANSTTNQYHKVTVKIGNVEFVGEIQFSYPHKRKDYTGEVVGISGGVVALLAVFVLIMVKKCMPFRRINLKKERNEEEFAVGRSMDSIVPPSISENRSAFDNRNDNLRPRINESRYIRYGNSAELRNPLLAEGSTNGECEFGCVYKGFLSTSNENENKLVAVKTILRDGCGGNVNEFLNEALMMKDFNHPHVLKLIGIALEDGEFPLVIIPYMKLGDLLSFIRNEENNPTVRELVSFGIDIAHGMEYLSGIKYTHRDLAARNCMLDEHKTAKVADFGLSRDIYSKEYYSCGNQTKLPVKWMAPESLEKGIYTSKSDVWSYGILLWELLTRGASPYPGVENWDVARYIKMGHRLPRPEYCPKALFITMSKCWQFNAGQRPTFTELLDEIMDIVLTKGQDTSVTDVPVDLEKCTNYDYGDHNIPAWAANLQVDLQSAGPEKISNQISWTSDQQDTLNIQPLANIQNSAQESESKINRSKYNSVEFNCDNESVQFNESGRKSTNSVSLKYINVDPQNETTMTKLDDQSETYPMLFESRDEDSFGDHNEKYSNYANMNSDIRNDEWDEDQNKTELSTDAVPNEKWNIDNISVTNNDNVSVSSNLSRDT